MAFGGRNFCQVQNNNKRYVLEQLSHYQYLICDIYESGNDIDNSIVKFNSVCGLVQKT